MLCYRYQSSSFFFLTKNGWFPAGIGVGWCPGEQAVSELFDIFFLCLELPTTVTVCCPAVIRTKQQVLRNYVSIKKEVKHFVAEPSSVSWLFAVVCLIYGVLKCTSFKHTICPLWRLSVISFDSITWEIWCNSTI